MNTITFSNFGAPKFILLGKSGLKCICWEVGVDVRFAAAPVTGMDTDNFTKQFFDFRNEWLLSWQLEIIESSIGRMKAPMERTRVVFFWHWDVLCCHLRGPEFVGCPGLLDAFLCQMRVGPNDCIVSFSL